MKQVYAVKTDSGNYVNNKPEKIIKVKYRTGDLVGYYNVSTGELVKTGLVLEVEPGFYKKTALYDMHLGENFQEINEICDRVKVFWSDSTVTLEPSPLKNMSILQKNPNTETK